MILTILRYRATRAIWDKKKLPWAQICRRPLAIPSPSFFSSPPWVSQNGPGRLPRRPTRAKIAHHVGSQPPRWLHIAQDGSQEAFKMAHHASKTAHGIPKTPPDEPRKAKIIENPMVFQ